MNRRVTIQTPLDDDSLQFRQLVGREEISQLYAFDIDLFSDSNGIEPKDLLGKAATVAVQTEGGEEQKRYLGGIVTRFGLQQEDARHAFYRMKLRPWLWLATRRSDFRIFQFKTVPDIIGEVLGSYGYPIDKRLTRSYRNWDYCVQYDESDFNFISRLCELEGIYYHFEHGADQHTLVFADDIAASHKPLPGGESVRFHPLDKSSVGERECIYAWELTQEIRSGHHYSDDYNFQKPQADLSNLRQMPQGHDHDDYEDYEWPGGFSEHEDGEAYARIRTEQQLSQRSRVGGRSNLRQLAPGYTLRLEGHPRADQNQQYLLIGVSYHLQENLQASGGAGGADEGSVQRFMIEAQPTSLAWRPRRATPKPRTRGPQTATVVGPAGEEIWTDQYGRIKVQFHWDRLGRHDENSSCWVRVSSSWAGANFGAMFIPRIGMECIVDFLNGDPDYPIVTGCVYNARNMPAWPLPASQTQSGLLTRSSKGGGPDNANALRFEDKKGQEEIWLHAEKNLRTEVESSESHSVGANRSKTIGSNETTGIGENRTETVGGTHTETITKDRTVRVTAGQQTNVVKQDITMASTDASIFFSAPKEIRLMVGQSYISITDGQIEIIGPTKVIINQ